MLSALHFVATPTAQPLADALVVIRICIGSSHVKFRRQRRLSLSPKAGAKWLLHLLVLTGSTMNFARSANLRGHWFPGTSGIQLSSLGIPGEVVLGNALADKRRLVMYTPMHWLEKWPLRLQNS